MATGLCRCGIPFEVMAFEKNINHDCGHVIEVESMAITKVPRLLLQ